MLCDLNTIYRSPTLKAEVSILPVLLFNPALPCSSVAQNVPEQKIKRTSYLRVIIGDMDNIIDIRSTMDWIP